jgi:hypothetical protein
MNFWLVGCFLLLLGPSDDDYVCSPTLAGLEFYVISMLYAAGSIEDVTDDEDVLGRGEWVGLRHRFPWGANCLGSRSLWSGGIEILVPVLICLLFGPQHSTRIKEYVYHGYGQDGGR